MCVRAWICGFWHQWFCQIRWYHMMQFVRIRQWIEHRRAYKVVWKYWWSLPTTSPGVKPEFKVWIADAPALSNRKNGLSPTFHYWANPGWISPHVQGRISIKKPANDISNLFHFFGCINAKGSRIVRSMPGAPQCIVCSCLFSSYCKQLGLSEIKYNRRLHLRIPRLPPSTPKCKEGLQEVEIDSIIMQPSEMSLSCLQN